MAGTSPRDPLSSCVALRWFQGSASAQAVIKVSDDVNIKFGMLLQTQADWAQDAATGSYQENLFIRRVRFLVGGQVAPKITFFFETDDPNLGKSVSGTKSISTGFIVQDAYLEWKAADAFALDAGLIFIPLCRNCIQSAATLLAIDYGAYSFLHGGPTRSVVGRDTGFMARGYLAKSRLEYRVWARRRSSRSAADTTCSPITRRSRATRTWTIPSAPRAP